MYRLQELFGEHLMVKMGSSIEQGALRQVPCEVQLVDLEDEFEAPMHICQPNDPRMRVVIKITFNRRLRKEM